MIHEKRVYAINPLKMADWLVLYQSDALAVQIDHFSKLISSFFTEIGMVNQVVHIWAHENLDDRLARHMRMAQGECWRTFSWKNRELATVERLESVLMHPIAFLPLRQGVHHGQTYESECAGGWLWRGGTLCRGHRGHA